MKFDIIERIEILEGIEASVKDNLVVLKFGDKKNQRKFSFYGVELKKENNEIIIEAKKATRRELKVIGTIKSHIKNMIKGLKKPFVYKMEIAFVHFPMTVEYNVAKNRLAIKNFLGEKKERIANILPEVEIEIDKQMISLKSHNKELVGQTAANIEKATVVRMKDRRKFQDGIYISDKNGRKI